MIDDQLGSGFSGSYKGTQFQIKILKLFSLKSMRSTFNFNVWTEDGNADKFDDMLYSYTSNNQTRYTFLQAKHKMTPFDIELKTLFNDKNFDLYKYFVSFLKIEMNFDIDYKSRDIEDLIIVTNNVFPKNSPNDKFVILLENSSNGNPALYFEQQSNHRIFNMEGKMFKFDIAKEIDNMKFFKLKILLFELMQFLLDNNFETHVLKHSKDFLTSHVFDITSDSIKFKDEFLNSANSDTKYFRELFQEILSCKSLTVGKNKKIKLQNDFWGCLKKLKFDRNFITKINSFDNDDGFVDKKIEDFMRKLLFVTEIDESEVDRSISLEILSLINDASKIGDAIVALNDTLDDWLFMKKQNSIVSPYVGSKLDNQFFIQIFKPFSENTVFKQPNPEFLESQGIKDFLISTSDSLQILIYEVAKGETWWGCLKVYGMKNSLIFVNSQTGEDHFKKVLDAMKHASTDHLLLVQDDTRILAELKELKGTSKAKVIVVCDSKIAKSFVGYQKISEKEFLCGQLSDDSFQNFLQKSVNFQGVPTKLEQLIDSTQLKNIPLKELEGLEEIGEAPEEPEFYLPRTLVKQVHLKEAILKDFPTTESIVFSESDYKSQLGIKPVHWVAKTVKTEEAQTRQIKSSFENEKKEMQSYEYMWMQSSKDLKYMRPHIHEKKTQVNMEECPNQVNIIRDIAGMGKSVYLAHLSVELKKKFPNYWVQKMDLQSYPNELKNFKSDTIVENNTNKTLNFFIKKFIKAGNSYILNVIFKKLIRNGHAVFLFDGFDEIDDLFKEIILKIISTLRDTSNHIKIFISTRPEWAEKLEDQFIQFSHFFQPFTSEDQQNFMLKIWKKDDSWKDVTKRILDMLDESITDRERSFTGIPLITKLVSDFFLDDIQKKVNTEMWKLSNFNFYKLLDNYINRKFKIFLVQKQKLEETHRLYKRTLRSLKIDHQKLALKLLFPQSAEQLYLSLEELDEEVMQQFIDCGLVECINGQLKFHHQTSAEFLATIYFEEHFDRPSVLKLLFEVVLIENGYQMIRSLIDSFIAKKVVNVETKLVVRELIVKHQSVLNVAAKESNLNTFECFFGILSEITERNKLQSLFLQKDADDCNLLFNLLRHCEIDSEFLNKISNKLGLSFLKNVLNSKNRNKNLTIMGGAALHGKNNLPLLKWLTDNFSDDACFIREIISTKDNSGNSILHNAVEKFDKNQFMKFLHEMKLLDEGLLLDELLLELNSENYSFLYSLIHVLSNSNLKTNSEAFDDIIELSKWISGNTNVFEKILLIGNRTVVDIIAWKFTKHLTKFLEFLIKRIDIHKVFKSKNDLGMHFFNYIFHDSAKFESAETACQVLDWIRSFDSQLFTDVIFNKNIDGSNSIHRMCWNASKSDLPSIFKTMLNYLQKNIPDFDTNKILKEKDNYGDNFLTYVFLGSAEFESAEAACQILNWIKSIDFQLFTDVVFNKNINGLNFIHNMCWYALKSDLPRILKKIINYLQKNISDFDTIKILKEKDTYGDTFLTYVFDSAKSESAEAACQILDWIKSIDFQLFTEIILNRNSYGANFMHKMCRYTSKSDLPNVFKKMIDYLQQNLSDCNTNKILKQKNNNGENFLDYVFADSANFESAEAACQILDLVKSVDFQLFTDIVFNKSINGSNFIHRMCRYASTTDFPSIFKNIFYYLQQNIPDFNINQFLKDKDSDGDNFLRYVFADSTKSESAEAACKILDWIKSFDFELVFDIVFNKSINGSNFIHRMCRYASKFDLPIIFKKTINYLKKIIPDFNRHKILKERDNFGDNFLRHIFADFAKFKSAEAACTILKWIKGFDLQLFTDVIFNKNNEGSNFIHQMCRYSSKTDLSSIFKAIINFLHENIPQLNLDEFLNIRNKSGKTCFDFIDLWDKTPAALSSKTEIINWLSSIGFECFRLSNVE